MQRRRHLSNSTMCVRVCAKVVICVCADSYGADILRVNQRVGGFKNNCEVTFCQRIYAILYSNWPNP